MKGIAPTNIKEKYKERDTRNVIFTELPIPMNISIFQDKVVFTPWEDKKISFLIYSKQLAESFRNYFNSIWNNK